MHGETIFLMENAFAGRFASSRVRGAASRACRSASARARRLGRADVRSCSLPIVRPTQSVRAFAVAGTPGGVLHESLLRTLTSRTTSWSQPRSDTLPDLTARYGADDEVNLHSAVLMTKPFAALTLRTHHYISSSAGLVPLGGVLYGIEGRLELTRTHIGARHVRLLQYALPRQIDTS